ncbi:MAG: peptide chain release factor 2 [Desulfobacterales bacterium]
MSVELKQNLNALKVKLEHLRAIFDLDGIEKRLAEIENTIARNGFWDNPEDSKSILKERTLISNKINRFKKLWSDLEENQILLDLAVEESDAETLDEVSQQTNALDELIDQLSLDLMLDGEDDSKNAIVSINAGAGGTEAQDWAEMLFRMYSRWIERRGFKFEMIDFQPGDEAGIKGATFTASGENAFGYLKSEIGVHRLVRISPFNASGKRHTSFASVFVYPELDAEIVVDIDDKDLRIDVFRASGAGGQHVNKTSSAVRITHLPTGIVVQCQQEKSQHRNKDLAMKVLKARLYQREREKQDEKMQELHDSKEDIAWGSQIRSYVLHPYQMVKDHRIDLDVGNINDVLDGGIDPFIEGFLLAKK